MFNCPKCNKQLKSQCGLDYHLSKSVCYKSNRICPKCLRTFSSKKYCQTHIDKNICGKDPEAKQPCVNLSRDELIIKLSETEDKLSKTEDKLSNTEGKCEALKDKLSNTEGKYEALKDRPPNITIVFPNAFGKEDLIHIQDKLVDVVGTVIKNNLFHSIYYYP
jgi:hypothetical protein